MESKDIIYSILTQQGLSDYKWINPKDVVVANWVRVKCAFGCGDYGLGACPPNTPSVSECESFFREYETGLIIRFNKFIDKNSYPSGWSDEITEKLIEAERKIFLAGFHKVFLLNQSCCELCKDCSGNRLDCKDKIKSRPSPEGFAVDVYETVRKAGMDINVVKENPAEVTRIAILLIE